MRSLRGYLVAMATLLVVLLCAGSGLLIWQIERFNRAQAERQMLDTSRAMSLAVDGRLQTYRIIARALSRSGAMRARDWAALDGEARGLLADRDAWVTVGARDGRQLVNSRLAPGAPLPGPVANAAFWQELDNGQDRVCTLTHGRVEPDILCFDSPVMQDGRAAFLVSVVFRPRLLQELMQPGRIGEGQFLTVIDRQGKVIWRNVHPERFVGQLARAELRHATAAQSEGTMESVSLEGTPTRLAFTRSPVSGWTFVVATPRRDVAGGQRTLRYSSIAAAMLIALGAALGLLAGRRISRAVGRLSSAAQRIQRGQPPAYEPSGMGEIDAIGALLEAAIAARDATQERFALAQEVGGIGSWDWDMLKDEGHVSEAYKEMHGLTATTGPLRVAQVQAAIHPDDLPYHQARLAVAMSMAGASTNDYRVVLPDGSIRWVATKGRPIFEDGLLVGAIGVVMDMTDRKAAEDRMRLLMREVDHRANNLMAVVQATVTLSRAPTVEALRVLIIGRIDALARAHQLLAESRWQGADLRRLVDEEMAPYTLGDGARVAVDGPGVPLAPAAAQAVAIGLHELATNAAKHGALSTAEGRVSIRWRVADGRLRLNWTETGGPPVQPPTTRGFGTTVLRRALDGPVRGQTRLDWRPEGLVCEMELPVGEAGDE